MSSPAASAPAPPRRRPAPASPAAAPGARGRARARRAPPSVPGTKSAWARGLVEGPRTALRRPILPSGRPAAILPTLVLADTSPSGAKPSTAHSDYTSGAAVDARPPRIVLRTRELSCWLLSATSCSICSTNDALERCKTPQNRTQNARTQAHRSDHQFVQQKRVGTNHICDNQKTVF